MDIERCTKDAKLPLPLSAIGVDGDGWVLTYPKDEGIMVTLRGQEKASGGCVITKKQLAAAGYVDANNLREQFSVLTVRIIQHIAREIGIRPAKGRRKKDLLKEILK